jgi:hypothetical protein
MFSIGGYSYSANSIAPVASEAMRKTLACSAVKFGRHRHRLLIRDQRHTSRSTRRSLQEAKARDGRLRQEHHITSLLA